MKTENHFIKPNFLNAKLEFRVENNIICIYGTAEGLRWFIEQCQALINNPKKFLYHSHIDRSIPPEVVPRVLTEQSLEAIIFIYLPPAKCKDEKSRQSIWKFLFGTTEKQSVSFDGDLEFRFMEETNKEVHICGTEKGLHWLITQCDNLIASPSLSHIHIDPTHDMYRLLTKQSLDASIAIFSSTGQAY